MEKKDDGAKYEDKNETTTKKAEGARMCDYFVLAVVAPSQQDRFVCPPAAKAVKHFTRGKAQDSQKEPKRKERNYDEDDTAVASRGKKEM